MMRSLTSRILPVLAGLILSVPASAQLYTYRHAAMGTEFTVYLYASSETEAQSASSAVFDEVDRIEQELSNYRDTSELSRIDREAALAPTTTDPETFSFLAQSLHWSQASDGAFDITVGPLMKSWGFFRSTGRIPTAADLARIRPLVGYQNLELDPATRSVHFRVPGVDLDPGGIGKGFAVDAAVAILRAHHISAALLSAGSSTLYGLGHPPGQPGWRVVIPAATPNAPPVSTVLLRDTSLSTANCNEKHFTADGHLYCHIMDPRTLRPVEGRLQVSVIDASATTSDALSNVLFVDTPTQSLAFLRHEAPNARALILTTGHGCTLYRWRWNNRKSLNRSLAQRIH